MRTFHGNPGCAIFPIYVQLQLKKVIQPTTSPPDLPSYMEFVKEQPNFVLLTSGYLHELESICNIRIGEEIFRLIANFYPLSHKVKYHSHYTVPAISSTEWESDTDHVFESLKISEFGSMRLSKHNRGVMMITVVKDLILGKYATIQVNGQGHVGGKFGQNGDSALNKYGGQGAITYSNCGGGGGYATPGTKGDDSDNYWIHAKGGNCFGDAMCKYLYGGSGGGGSRVGGVGNIGGSGGGVLILRVYGSLYLNEYSSIEANGNIGYGIRDGCGSGGTILLYCTNLKMNNDMISDTMIIAKGGENKRRYTGFYGGSGGDGRIVIDCRNKERIRLNGICSPKPYVL